MNKKGQPLWRNDDKKDHNPTCPTGIEALTMLAELDTMMNETDTEIDDDADTERDPATEIELMLFLNERG